MNGNLNIRSGNLVLADDTTINVSSKDSKILTDLFNKLNNSNKKAMYSNMIRNKKSFNDMLVFAKKV